ncbi:4-hydroxy-tetrahydrodipicolinate synthase [Rhodococcus zopfii]|uniref:4-hydroxy-tetrahydrodipicolinate synthase n=1 Tax=Rhodococcus zopfii TaxID=43772 RepID=A0ABU3WPF6_9NOCA|nr:4-hydroxy-tetrahydrodipicolinate synthase [Rhodococcus zopfii]
MTFRPSGILVPLVTPFADSGHVEAADLHRLAQTVIDDGAAGLVALGTTAEAATLSPQERRDVVRVCAAVCRERRVPLLVGTGTNDTAGTVRALNEVGEQPDVAGALVVVPYCTRPTEAGVVAHFEYVADRSPVPIVLYNVPYRTGQQLGWESVVRLSEHPRIVGVKQAVGAIDTDTARLLAECPAEFSVLAGEDTLVSPLLAMGAAGAIAATANVCAAEFAGLFRSWSAGRVEQARDLGNRLAAPVSALMSGPNPTVIKAVLHAQGKISSSNVRLPLLPADDAAAIAGVLAHLSAQVGR